MVILKIGHHLSQKQPTNTQKTNIQTELLWKFYLVNLGMFYLNWKKHNCAFMIDISIIFIFSFIVTNLSF